jgi:hypothetical protein
MDSDFLILIKKRGLKQHGTRRVGSTRQSRGNDLLPDPAQMHGSYAQIGSDHIQRNTLHE